MSDARVTTTASGRLSTGTLTPARRRPRVDRRERHRQAEGPSATPGSSRAATPELGPDAAMASEPLWTVRDVSEFLRIPVSTLHQWRYEGKGPDAYRIGKHLRYDPGAVRTWLDRECRHARA